MSSRYCRLCGHLAWPDGTEPPNPKDVKIKELETQLKAAREHFKSCDECRDCFAESDPEGYAALVEKGETS